MHIPVTEVKIGESGRLFIARTKAKDVVHLLGSVLGGENMLPREWAIVSDLAADLFDAGTKTKKKALIREGLENRGISLSFHSVGDRTSFSGHCFPEDLPILLSTIVECLAGANFPESELKPLKERTLGELAEAKTDTNGQAGRALTQLIYDSSHPNYIRSLQEIENAVKRTRRTQLENFHKLIGAGGLVLSIVGDIDPNTTETLVQKAFKKLPKGTLHPSEKVFNRKAQTAGQKLVPIADKANVDVLLGVSLPLTKQDAAFHPAMIIADMLGGGFAGHLMQTIRERDGLTYRTYAGISGVSDGTDGYFKVYASFNPSRYEESVDKLRKEVRTFFASGLTEDALTKKKEEIVGSYVVGLSTTSGLAGTLHTIGTDGRELSYLNEYPDIINKVSLTEIHTAADMIPLNKLSLAAAGTFPKK